MVSVPAIATVAAVVVVIKEEHIVVQIIEERAQLQTVALRRDESICVSSVIKPIVLISLIVTIPSFLGVAAMTLKKT